MRLVGEVQAAGEPPVEIGLERRDADGIERLVTAGAARETGKVRLVAP